MDIDITKTDGTTLANLTFVTGVAQTVRVKNLTTAAKHCLLFLSGNDDKPSSLTGVTNDEGKELISEAWGLARKLGDTPWTTIGEPTYASTFAGTTVNCLAFTLADSAYQDIEVKTTVPAGADSKALIQFQLRCLSKDD